MDNEDVTPQPPRRARKVNSIKEVSKKKKEEEEKRIKEVATPKLSLRISSVHLLED